MLAVISPEHSEIIRNTVKTDTFLSGTAYPGQVTHRSVRDAFCQSLYIIRKRSMDIIVFRIKVVVAIPAQEYVKHPYEV